MEKDRQKKKAPQHAETARQLARADLELDPRRCHSFLKLERALFVHS
jgi:hypothetical protein